MTSFQQLFGGNTIKASNQSYVALAPATDVRLAWPIEQSVTGDNVVADVISVAAGAANVSIFMPDARQASTGYSTTVVNNGALSFTIKTTTGGPIVSPAPGTAWVVLLTNNASGSGVWQTFQLGASVALAQASALAGTGLSARDGRLDQNTPVKFVVSSPYIPPYEDIASLVRWTGAVGTFELSAANTYGGGWFTHIHNSGSGTLTLDPTSTIDGASTKTLAAGVGCLLFTDGADWYTIGSTATATGTFDYTSIAIAGGGNYTLSGAELNRVAYNFTGILTADRTIIVPASIQQYWISNSTTGAFRLYVKTAGQASPGIEIVQGTRAILYCDGTNVVDADTNTVTFPITISQGGTGGATQATARTGLGSGAVGDAVFVAATTLAAQTAMGGTVVGRGVFSAVDAAAARTAIAAAGTGSNVFSEPQGITSGFPGILYTESDAPANGRRWFHVHDAGTYSIRLQNDAETVEHYAMILSRSGTTPGPAEFRVPSIDLVYGTPSILLDDTTATANNRRWRIRNVGEGLYFSLYTDDESSGTNSIWIERTGVNTDRISMIANDVFMFSNLRFPADATEYKAISGTVAGPEVRAKWNSSTTDRYLQIGIRDNLSGFTELMRFQETNITFYNWPTVNGIRMDFGAGAVKATTTSRTSDISLTADPELVATCNVGNYMVEGQLIFDCASSGAQGMQFALVHSAAAATLRYQLDGVVDGVATTTLGVVGSAVATQGTTVQFVTISTISNGNAIHFRGTALVVADGTLGVRWGQRSSNAVSTNLKAGSFLKLTRVS